MTRTPQQVMALVARTGRVWLIGGKALTNPTASIIRYLDAAEYLLPVGGLRGQYPAVFDPSSN